MDLLLAHKRLIRLFTILYTLLEQNASLEALTAFKQKTVEELGLVAAFLAGVLPFPSAAAAGEFLIAQSSLAIGSYPMMDLTPKQTAAMQAVGMDTDPAYYIEMLRHSIQLLLQGMIQVGG